MKNTTGYKILAIFLAIIAAAAIAASGVYIYMRGNVKDGTDGTGIKSIKPGGTDANGANVYTVTLSDNTSYTFAAPQGQPGKDGVDGIDGIDGNNGTDGQTPYIGDNGNWVIGETDTGVKAAGEDGADGESPAPMYAHYMKVGYVYATFVTSRPEVYTDFETLYNDLLDVNNTGRVAINVSGCFVKNEPSVLFVAESCYIKEHYEEETSYYAEVRCRRVEFRQDDSLPYGINIIAGGQTEINSNSITDLSVYPLFVPVSE